MLQVFIKSRFRTMRTLRIPAGRSMLDVFNNAWLWWAGCCPEFSSPPTDSAQVQGSCWSFDIRCWRWTSMNQDQPTCLFQINQVDPSCLFQINQFAYSCLFQIKQVGYSLLIPSQPCCWPRFSNIGWAATPAVSRFQPHQPGPLRSSPLVLPAPMENR